MTSSDVVYYVKCGHDYNWMLAVAILECLDYQFLDLLILLAVAPSLWPPTSLVRVLFLTAKLFQMLSMDFCFNYSENAHLV